MYTMHIYTCTYTITDIDIDGNVCGDGDWLYIYYLTIFYVAPDQCCEI